MSRPLPHAMDSETAVLGALLMDPKGAIRACWDAGLAADDFSAPQHGWLYDLIQQRIRLGAQVDEQTILEAAKRETVKIDRNREVSGLDHLGGAMKLLELADKVPVVSHAKQYASTVVDTSLHRQLIVTADELAEAGHKLAPIDQAVMAAERVLASVRDRADGRHMQSVSSKVDDALQQVLTDYLSPDPLDTVSFPLNALTEVSGGQFPGDVVITGADSGEGKTWWLLDCIEAAVLQGRRTVVMSGEMPRPSIVKRLIAMGGHNFGALRKKRLPYDALADRVAQIDSWGSLLDVYDGRPTVNRLQGILSSARIEGRPIRYVGIDHIQLLKMEGGRDGYRLGLNEALADFKQMAVEHGATIHLLSQLTKPAGDAALGKRPTKRDLRESKGIEEIADVVLLLHRERDEDGYRTAQGSVIVEKVREGSGEGEIDVQFSPVNYRFREYVKPFQAGMGAVA